MIRSIPSTHVMTHDALESTLVSVTSFNLPKSTGGLGP